MTYSLLDMDIHKGIKIFDLGLLIGDTLIISDLHIGYEEELQKKGIFIPKFQFKDLTKRLKYIIEQTDPAHIIINGDLKHEFGTISQQEWMETVQILDLLMKDKRKVTLIKGNHDTILEPIAQKRNLDILEYFVMDDILIIHGDRSVAIPDKIKTIIVGHMHPAITLAQGPKSERYKCFLKGEYKKRTLIIMPSFHEFTKGADVIEDDAFGLIRDQSIKDFDVFVVGDDHKVYEFGKVRNVIEFV